MEPIHLPSISVLCGGGCCSVAQSHPTLCDPMDCSMPAFPALHHLPEFAPTHVHWVNDATQTFHPLSPPSPSVLNLSQYQCIFQWVSASHQLVKVLDHIRPYSASVLPMSIQGWFPSGLTDLTSLLSKVTNPAQTLKLQIINIYDLIVSEDRSPGQTHRMMLA